MKFRFLTTNPAVQGGGGNIFTKQIPAGNYTGIRLTLTGETDAGQTLELDDIGTIFVQKSGFGQLVRADYGFLNRYADLKGGFPPTVTGEAGEAERVVCTVPFMIPEFPNSQQVFDDNTLSLKIEFKNALATRFGSNPVNVRVDLIEADDISQDYDLVIDTQNQQLNSAGTESDNLTGSNIVKLYLKSDGVVDEITYVQDGKTIVDNTPIGVLRDQTNIENRIENAGEPWVEISPSGRVKETTMNRANTIQTVFNSGGTMELYKFRMQWLDQSRQNANAQAVIARLRGA